MALGIIDNSEMTYFDYQKEWVNRYSGYYGNFFEILRTFVDCNICKFQEKLFLIFQLIAICIEFILPSLASMVIYTVFYEAFATYDYRIALFFTSLYLSMMFTSGVCSLISKDPSRMKMTNYFLYFFMEIFYLLVLICSVPAMHFVNINKIEDYISEYEEDYCSSRKTNGNYTHCCLFEDTNGNYGCRGITDDEYENIVRFKKYLRDQVGDDSIRVDCSSRFISISLLAVLALLF